VELSTSPPMIEKSDKTERKFENDLVGGNLGLSVTGYYNQRRQELFTSSPIPEEVDKKKRR
jgi:hypothetical protein